MAAVRLGFAVANDTLTKVIRAVKSPYNLNTVSQEIGAVVYRKKEEAKAAAQALIASRKALEKGLCALSEQFFGRLQVFPSVTNFVLIKTAEAQAIYTALLEMGIAIRYMGAYLRITAGTKEENKEVLEALLTVLKRRN